MTFDRRLAIKSYADKNWFKPCEDKLVWLNNSPINIDLKRKELGLSETEWEAVFLSYDTRHVDGLYFIRKEHVPRLSILKFHAPNISNDDDKIFVQPWEGLNDCAHFVSECLRAGKVGVYEVHVARLIEKLRSQSDTKTLAFFVDVEIAERIVKSGIMKVGDIIAFGEPNKTFTNHGHSTIFMGENKVANHTHLNHPNYIGRGDVEFERGNWKRYATIFHPLVTLIHFSDGDLDLSTSSLIGWWLVMWRGEKYYYYFEKTGKVTYVKIEPTNFKYGPNNPAGKGFWFESGTDVKICWTYTGSLEVFTHVPGEPTMSGTWNENPAEKLLATKIKQPK